MIETNVENDIKEQEHYHIHKCLDYLWAVVADDYANKHPKEGISTLIEFKNYFRNYKIYSEDYNDLNNWVNIVHSKWITLTRIILFITGSILLIIPKFTKEKR